MVDLSDPKGPVKEGIDNTIFIVPGIIMAILICEYTANMSVWFANYSGRQSS